MSRKGPPAAGATVALLLAWAAAAPPAADGQQARSTSAADAASVQVSLLETGDAGCRAEVALLEAAGPGRRLSTDRRGVRAYVAHTRRARPTTTGGGRRGAGPYRGPDGAAAGNGEVTVVDLRDRRTVDRFHLGATGPISDVWAGHEGGRIWVALERDGRVLTLDSRSGELLMEWTIGRTSPQSGAVSRDDRYLFVTNREAGTLTVIDRVTVAANTVPLDRGAGAVGVGPAGHAWVADSDNGRLWVVDGESGRVVAELPSGGRTPVDVERRPGEQELWVLDGDGAGLQVYDAENPHQSGAVALPGRPRSVWFSGDGRHAYVSVPDRGLVVAVDAVRRRVEGSFPVGSGRAPDASCPGR